jgi:hypothetical protein
MLPRSFDCAIMEADCVCPQSNDDAASQGSGENVRV